MSDQMPLAGRYYLLVEDEYLVASSLASALEDAGARVLGPVSTVDQAMEITRDPSVAIHGAILDVNLQGEMVYPFAEVLAKRNLPIVFVTGYECSAMPDSFRNVPCLTKPCNEQELIAILADHGRERI